MKKRKESIKQTPHVVIFVEGETDEVFFNRLLSYYNKTSITPLFSYEIQNLRGVSRYASSKFVGKLEAEIIPKCHRKGMKVYGVCCSYDTDVFDTDESPIINWQRLKKSILRLGVEEFCRIEVEYAIEDWLLDDIEGLCRYLKMKNGPKSMKGVTGYAKILNLFKQSGKVYVKGISVESFIDLLDIRKIRNKRKSALSELERILNVTIP